MLTCLAFLAGVSCYDAGGVSSAGYTTLTTESGVKLRAEVVATPESRAKGLMHRAELGENEGMLFVYPDKSIREFWMMNTPLALSIAFLDDDGTIVNIEDMAPADPGPRYRSSRPVRYAVEVRQGWFFRKGVVPGQKLGFKLPSKLSIR